MDGFSSSDDTAVEMDTVGDHTNKYDRLHRHKLYNYSVKTFKTIYIYVCYVSDSNS